MKAVSFLRAVAVTSLVVTAGLATAETVTQDTLAPLSAAEQAEFLRLLSKLT